MPRPAAAGVAPVTQPVGAAEVCAASSTGPGVVVDAAGVKAVVASQRGAPAVVGVGGAVAKPPPATSLGWDGRAVTNFICATLAGPAVLTVFRRAAREARFQAPIRFVR